jgi:hypothetical protein
MKRLASISICSLALVALLAISCASSAPAPAEAPAQVKNEAPAPAPEAKAPEKVAKQRTVVTKVPVLVKETSFYPDGLKDEYSTYKLDEAKRNILEKVTYDAARAEPTERLVSEYKDGVLAAETIYESDGKVRTRRELSYDGQGRLVSERVLDAKGKGQSSSSYSYDDKGRKVEWRALDGSGSLKALTSYSYGADGLAAMNLKNASGASTGSIKLEYQGGKLARRSYLAMDGSLQKYEAYVYADGRLSAVENRRADGSLASKTSYEYGPIGEVLKTVESDSSSSVKGYSLYEYVIREDSSIETYYE